MEYWNPKVERLSAEELQQPQERKLRRSVENAYEYSSFYKKRFAAAGGSPHDIRSLEDIQQLPFTHKTDLRDTYPTGMFSVPQSQIARFHDFFATRRDYEGVSLFRKSARRHLALNARGPPTTPSTSKRIQRLVFVELLLVLAGSALVVFVASDLVLWTTICSVLIVACLAAWRRDIVQKARGAR